MGVIHAGNDGYHSNYTTWEVEAERSGIPSHIGLFDQTKRDGTTRSWRFSSEVESLSGAHEFPGLSIY